MVMEENWNRSSLEAGHGRSENKVGELENTDILTVGKTERSSTSGGRNRRNPLKKPAAGWLEPRGQGLAITNAISDCLMF
jgi:hypothetical protein